MDCTAQNVGRPILTEFVLQVNDLVERDPLEFRPVSEERGCSKPIVWEPVVELEPVDWNPLPLPDKALLLTACSVDVHH